MEKTFHEKTNELLQSAYQLALSKKHSQLTTEHVLSMLADHPSIQGLLEAVQVPASVLHQISDPYLQNLPQVSSANIQPSSILTRCLEQSASILDEPSISLASVLMACLFYDHSVQARFQKLSKVTLEMLKQAEQQRRKVKSFEEVQNEGQPSALSQYGRDLVELAKQQKLEPIIGRDTHIRRVMEILCRKTKNNPILIGEPGVGKTAIVEGLAQWIANQDVPEILKHKKIIELDLGLVLAGAKYQGEFEERMKKVMDEVQSSNGMIILFIDEIHTVLTAGKSSGGIDAANLLKPLLARGELRCIGATTFQEYRQNFEKDPALARRFQRVQVDEPTIQETLLVLRGLKNRYESYHGVTIRDEAFQAAATYADRYITDRFLPDKAIDLIDEACAMVRVQLDSVPEHIDQLRRAVIELEIEVASLKQEQDEKAQKRYQEVQQLLNKQKEQLADVSSEWNDAQAIIERRKNCIDQLEQAKKQQKLAEQATRYEEAAKLQYETIPQLEKEIQQLQNRSHPSTTETITSATIAHIVSRMTGIEVGRIETAEKNKILGLQERLRKVIQGQDHAVQKVAEAILRSKAGLQNSKRPLGSFLFLGPTGVGKSELAKQLAKELFDSERQLIRLDMSEYMEKFSASRLIGAPPGYVGYEEGGQLTEAVRRNPYAIVLLDEVEKAHPDVFHLLLQLLEEGTLTDNKGVHVDFSNTIIILTSNLGSEHASILKEEAYRQGAKQFFKPELLNRLDQILVFSPLSNEVMIQITRLELEKLSQLLKKRDIDMEWSTDVIEWVASLGYHEEYGARQLRRVIQEVIETPLALYLLSTETTNQRIIARKIEENVSFEVVAS